MSCAEYDVILVDGLSIPMLIGVYDHEKASKQRVFIDVEAKTRPNIAHKSDNIRDALSYEEIISDIKALAQGKHYELVESYAEDIAASLFSYAAVESLKITVKKPDIFDDAQSVGITIHRNRK